MDEHDNEKEWRQFMLAEIKDLKHEVRSLKATVAKVSIFITTAFLMGKEAAVKIIEKLQ
jgi:hypothetical protein